MIKALLIAVLGVAFVLTGTASAEWYNYDSSDEFNGRRWKISQVKGKTTDGPSSHPYTPTYNTPVIYFANSAERGLLLHLISGDQQICKDVKIDVTIDGKRPFREMVVKSVLDNNKRISIERPDYWYERFKSGDLLRIRTTDSCFTRFEMSFDITGQPNVELDDS